MPTAKQFDPGNILLASYPFTNRAAIKLRPVLVVSAAPFNTHGDYVVLPISSRTDSPIARQHGFMLPDSAPYFAQTGLHQSSVVKWSKPLTLSSQVIVRRLGDLPTDVLTEITKKLAAMLEGVQVSN